jgi:6-phosphogluconolactonase
VYLVTELGSSVFVFDFDAASGAWTPTQKVSALPAGYAGRKWSADLHVAPSGKFLYASNRAHESLAVFAIDGATGMVTLVEHVAVDGKTPRNFSVGPGGKFLQSPTRTRTTWSPSPSTPGPAS